MRPVFGQYVSHLLKDMRSGCLHFIISVFKQQKPGFAGLLNTFLLKILLGCKDAIKAIYYPVSPNQVIQNNLRGISFGIG